MLYLIDGYNVTKSDPASRGLPLQDQREALISRLAISGDSMLGKGQKIVVFDGPLEAPGAQRSGDVDVRFSRGESADEVLVRLARASKQRVCIVTSDRELAGRVRGASSAGAEHLHREKLFAGSVRSRASKTSKRYPASTVGLPKGANRITEELKGVWLEGEE